MKNITNTLGRVIVVIAAVALLIGVVGMVAAPGISGFMGSVTNTMTNKGDDMLESIGTPHAQGTPKLETPVVTLSGNTLTITPVANATSYRVYNGNDLLVETAETTVDLATYLPNVGNYSIRVMAMAAGYKDSSNAQVDYIKQLAPGLYETGSNYTVLKKSWDDMITDGWITDNGKVVSGKESLLIGDLMILPEITTIVASSYSGCYALTDVIIPDGVTSIGASAFASCTKLEKLIIPNGVTVINPSTFSGCKALTSVGPVGSGAALELPNSVTTIGDKAFYQNTGLTSVTIPDSVTSIGNESFYRCHGLKSITIPDNVTTIGDSAFYECGGLESVTISDSVTTISANAFYNCSTLTNITFGNNVTTIGQFAFWNCRGLKDITIPDSVTTIGKASFQNCINLTSATFENTSGWCIYGSFGGLEPVSETYFTDAATAAITLCTTYVNNDLIRNDT